jgi:circadian clock protein KaiB
MAEHTNKIAEFLEAAHVQGVEPIVLRLYIAGTAYRSARAVERVKQICEGCLSGRYFLEVIDLYQQPALAQRDQIVALPTLIRLSPAPPRRVVGDMTDTERVLEGLGVRPDGPAPE